MKRLNQCSKHDFIRLFFAFITLAMFVAAVLCPDRAEMFTGMKALLTSTCKAATNAFAIGGFAGVNGMVAPLPDKAAAAAGMLVKHLEVILQITGAVAHSVTVFAKVERYFLILFSAFSGADFFEVILMSIHFREHIIMITLCTANALIMNRNIS